MRKFIFKQYHLLKNRNDFKLLKKILKNDSLSESKQIELQNFKFLKILNFSYKNIPFYKELYDSHNININKVKSLDDLNLLPIITKSDIKNNISKFKSPIKPFKYSATGGSTGSPLKFSMSKNDYEMAYALLYKAWIKVGYEVGDSVFVFAGGSLIGDKTIKSKLNSFLLNFKQFSSYGLDDNSMSEAAIQILRTKPKFLRGYSSAIYYLAKYFEQNNLDYHFSAVFTTSEMLLKVQKSKISKIFNCNVYSQYGLNDGGVSAFQLNDGTNNFHVDNERAILETVNHENKKTYNKSLPIIATSLLNYSFPFIRYDTGDLGILRNDQSSKREYLSSLDGRVTDLIKINNKIISGPVLTVLMGNINCEAYQFIIKNNKEIIVKIIKSINYTNSDQSFIENSLKDKIDVNLNISFDYVDKISSVNKHKFIININE
jgi:phenylacetate-CoA ligase